MKIHEPRYYMSDSGDELNTIHRVTIPDRKPAGHRAILVQMGDGSIASITEKYCFLTPEEAVASFMNSEIKKAAEHQRRCNTAKEKLRRAAALRDSLKSSES